MVELRQMPLAVVLHLLVRSRHYLIQKSSVLDLALKNVHGGVGLLLHVVGLQTGPLECYHVQGHKGAAARVEDLVFQQHGIHIEKRQKVDIGTLASSSTAHNSTLVLDLGACFCMVKVI